MFILIFLIRSKGNFGYQIHCAFLEYFGVFVPNPVSVLEQGNVMQRHRMASFVNVLTSKVQTTTIIFVKL